jgi:hypothetical protein
MFSLSAAPQRAGVACEATRPRQKATYRHTRARPIKVRGGDHGDA